MKVSLDDGGGDVEHNDIGFVEKSEIFEMRHDFFFGTILSGKGIIDMGGHLYLHY